jgi:hypothetical protein
MQGKLHSHAPHNFQQHAKVCNRDPTLMLRYFEPGKNQMFSKIVKMV